MHNSAVVADADLYGGRYATCETRLSSGASGGGREVVELVACGRRCRCFASSLEIAERPREMNGRNVIALNGSRAS